MSLTVRNVIVGLTAAGLLLTAGAFAEVKKDSTAAKAPNVIKGVVVKPSKLGKPTSFLIGDTIKTASGLKYIEVRPGTGGSPREGQTVSVHFVSMLLDGSKLDSSRDRDLPKEFVIGKGEVIKGWEEGVVSMRIGGVRKLIIPSQLAYGNKNGPDGIPPKSDLVIEVELLGVK